MYLEAAVWVALSVFAPAAAALAWPRLAGRLGRWAPMVSAAGPWVHGLAPGYLALLSGAVLGRDYGLYGQGWAEWLAGATVFAGVLIGGGWLLSRAPLPPTAVLPAPAEAVRQEVRWGLYRAAGALWTGAAASAVAVGLGLALLEWGLVSRIWAGRPWRNAAAWVAVVRLGLSSMLFLSTGNFWLTVATQIGLLLFAMKQGRRPAAPGPTDEPDAQKEAV